MMRCCSRVRRWLKLLCTRMNVGSDSISWVALIALLMSNSLAKAQSRDYVYYQNFVYHADGNACRHTAPTGAFMVFLNHDESRTLLENAPRWSSSSDPNIDGKGTFGVELGNFAVPAIKVGDTVSVRFTCNETKQQGELTEVITSIPWYKFPAMLKLAPATIPDPPQNLALASAENGQRLITWKQEVGFAYTVYRRDLSDTLQNGKARMLYTRIAENLSSDHFVDSTAEATAKYGYIAFAISDQGVWSSHSEEVNEAPVVNLGDDLTIGYIARLPKIDYVWGDEVSQTSGWPKVGESILWQAQVKNWMPASLPAVPYKWYLDGVVIDSGTVNLPAGSEVAVLYPWSWTFDRHVLGFAIDVGNTVPEEEEKNNSLSVFTDAISVGFYVEQSLYDYFHQHQRELNVHSNCWEDWAQRQVSRWNQMFALAVYPESPNGVLDRIRIDEIVVVPDNALPLAGGGYPTNMPNLKDRTVDLQWGFTAEGVTSGFYANHTTVSDNNPFYYEGSLMHELGHARYLIDLYGFNVHDDGSGSTVAIREKEQLIVGTPYMPFLGGGAVYHTPIQGLMNSTYTYVDRYSAAALNLIAGYRARLGNYNAPGNIGVFMQDLPAQNRLTVKDESGKTLANAGVMVYQATGKANEWYGKHFDNIPDLELRTDVNGQVLLGRCPFSKTGVIQHTYGVSNGVIILRIEHQGKVGYTFMESTSFNLQYWSGKKTMGDYEVRVNMIPPTGITEAKEAEAPAAFALYQNYPNPFNGETRIEFDLPVAAQVLLTVHNIAGQWVATLLNEQVAAGHKAVIWNAKDDTGRELPSGLYFCKIQSGDFSEMKKMVVTK